VADNLAQERSRTRCLATTYLGATRSGQSYVVTVSAEYPSEPVDANRAVTVILAAMKGRSRWLQTAETRTDTGNPW
jgi:hypothetical protein